MNIDDIPGFEKTPDEIKDSIDAKKICKIADLTFGVITCVEDIEVIKELLDHRRESLEILISVHDGCTVMDRTDIELLVKKITGKTWEELQR